MNACAAWIFSALFLGACNPRGSGDAPSPLRTAEVAGGHDADPKSLASSQAVDASPSAAPASGTVPGQPSASPGQDAEQDKGAVPKRRYVAAVLGDSITSDRYGGGKFIRVLQERCPESRFLNFGKGGDMTNQMLSRLQSDILPIVASEGINTLVVYGGVNDLYSDISASRTNDRIERDLTSIYKKARAHGLLVIAVTVSPWGGFSRYFNERRGENTRLLNSWILGQKAEKNVDRVVDSFHILSCGEPDKLCPKYETNSHDGLHPGPMGHRLLGEKLAEEAFSDCR